MATRDLTTRFTNERRAFHSTARGVPTGLSAATPTDPVEALIVRVRATLKNTTGKLLPAYSAACDHSFRVVFDDAKIAAANQKVSDAQTAVTVELRRAGQQMKDLNAYPCTTPAQSAIKTNASRQLMQEMGQLMERQLEIGRRFRGGPSAAAPDSTMFSGSSGAARQDEQLMEQDSLALAEAEREVDERHTQFVHINTEAGQLAQMFRELSGIVHDQSGKLDTIENHTSDTVVRVTNGKNELTEADKTDVGSKKCCFRAMLILMVAIIIMILVIIGINVSKQNSA